MDLICAGSGTVQNSETSSRLAGESPQEQEHPSISPDQGLHRQLSLDKNVFEMWSASNREAVEQHFSGSVRKMVAPDIKLIDYFDEQLALARHKPTQQID